VFVFVSISWSDNSINVEYTCINNGSIVTNYNGKEVTAVPIQSPIQLDGFLNETLWEKAEPVTNFRQRELFEGSPASQKTEVKLLYDMENLYIGVICYDQEPKKIVHTELRWDGDIESDDCFTLIIDTFNDKRNGYYFSVNPNGAQYDALVKSLTNINDDWDGVWYAAARIAVYGWSVEISIPFKTLRFPNTPRQNWGINFRRFNPRINEEVLWCSWKRNDGINQISRAGTLIGIENIKTGKHFEVKPYNLGGMEHSNSESKTREKTFKYGLDVKYGLSSDVTLDFTTFTDFAQVEPDLEKINLTGFSLHYSEKRDFFLEGAEIFNFGQSEQSASIFYSRRIGITPDRGRELPIIAGAKLSGKIGSYSLGALNIQTGKKYEFPSTNNSVIRLKKDIMEKSYIGFIASNLYDANKHENQALGMDFLYNTDRFLKDKNFQISGFLAGTKTPGINKNNLAGKVNIAYPNELINTNMHYSFINENYNPEIGFVPRKGIKTFTSTFQFRPRPPIPFVKNLNIRPAIIYTTDKKNTLISRWSQITLFGIDTYADDSFCIYLIENYENREVNIFKDVIIPKQPYQWWNYRVYLNSSKNRRFSLFFNTELGDYYNGEKTSVNSGLLYKLNKHLALETNVDYNKISLDINDFQAQKYGTKIIVNLTTHLTSSMLIQWNNETNEINLNFRLHYIPKIGSNLYFVYNHQWDEMRNYRTIQNTGIAKIDYLFRF